jgi:hypothetical protein
MSRATLIADVCDGADAGQLRAWLAECSARPDTPPAGTVAVQTRLIRAVYRGQLPSGNEVYLKVMAFPRRRDRLRYWLRPLPALHEAAMLRAAHAAGVPCPRVAGLLTRRGSFGRPVLSILATAALPVLPGAVPRLHACSALAARLLDAGIVHPDLHEKNFVQLACGETAVLDLQSARVTAAAANAQARVRAAARLLAADWPQAEVGATVAAAGLLDRAYVVPALRRAQLLRVQALHRRVHRCRMESTEFAVFRRGWGAGVQRRNAPAGGHWHYGGAELIRLWLGARYCEVVDRESPQLGALFRNSWWLPRRCSVYIAPVGGAAQFEQRSARWLDGYLRFKHMIGSSRCGQELEPEAVLPWSGRGGA